MTIRFMADGRQFTDYRGANLRMSKYMAEFNTTNSSQLRGELQTHAESIMTHNATAGRKCTAREEVGKTALCGGPIAQYFFNIQEQ